jgi:hypothetical protein
MGHIGEITEVLALPEDDSPPRFAENAEKNEGKSKKDTGTKIVPDLLRSKALMPLHRSRRIFVLLVLVSFLGVLCDPGGDSCFFCALGGERI